MKKPLSYLIMIPVLSTLFFVSCKMDVPPEEYIPEYSAYSKDDNYEYLEILSFGDAGTGSAEQRATAAALSNYTSNNEIDFIINLGDNFYNVGVTSTKDSLWESGFEEMYDPSILTMPFYSILGNHDYQGNIQAQIDYVSPNNNRWQMPSRYYKINRTLSDGTSIDFIFLDTERIYYGDADQLVWLDTALKNSIADWKIVSGHKPLYSNGKHGPNIQLIIRLQEILKNRADVYIAGHEHDMQILDKVDGTYHIVNGSAAKRRDTYVSNNTIMATSRIGFMSFLFSKKDIVCNVIESGHGIIYSTVLKTK